MSKKVAALLPNKLLDKYSPTKIRARQHYSSVYSKTPHHKILRCGYTKWNKDLFFDKLLRCGCSFLRQAECISTFRQMWNIKAVAYWLGQDRLSCKGINTCCSGLCQSLSIELLRNGVGINMQSRNFRCCYTKYRICRIGRGRACFKTTTAWRCKEWLAASEEAFSLYWTVLPKPVNKPVSSASSLS